MGEYLNDIWKAGMRLASVMIIVIASLGFMSCTSSPTPTPTPSPTPTATPLPCIQGLSGEYTGNIVNQTVSQQSEVHVQMEQSGCFVQGVFTIFPPLEGSGPFSGSINDSSIEFTVQGDVKGFAVQFIFDGSIDLSQNMVGGYVVPPIPGLFTRQVGRWNLQRQ